jgi:hypothetical protein
LNCRFDYYYLDRKEAFGFSRDSLQDGVITEQVASVYPAPLAALEGRPRAWVATTTNIYQQDTQGIQRRGWLQVASSSPPGNSKASI